MIFNHTETTPTPNKWPCSCHWDLRPCLMWKRFSQATQLCHGCDLAVEWCTAGHWASGVIWARLAVVAPSELKSLQFGWNPSRIYIYIYIYTYMNLSNSMILGTPTCRKRWETSYPKRHTHWSHLRVEVVCGDSEARMLPAICHWLDARDEPFRSGLCGYPHVSFGAKERWPFTPFTSLSCRHESVTFLGSPIWPTSPAVESIGWNFWQVSTWAQLNWANFFESNGSTWITCRAAPSGCVPETHVPPQQIRKPKAVDIPHEDTTSLAA